ncbi:lysozyme family protein [Tsukamurella tyrosinosolvens]|uniref:hypothetical protein n=1 Tax=Tsukamurella tyrosinosolvens TaxID=57704 RepID=UPI002DD41C6A|nr:hypothetical protein [Tsukamurella tyrosinosolvens]MEC4615199.1 hypothetical protein [Tsukamurella tyrosinosolvens]
MTKSTARAPQHHSARFTGAIRGVAIAVALTVVLSGCSARLTRTPDAPASSASSAPSAPRAAAAMAKWAAIHSGPYLTPTTALESYSWAALVMGKNAPRCQLGWATLAAIGRITSDHGTSRSHSLGDDAVVRPSFREAQKPAAKDTDGGFYDGDAYADLLMGPLLFAPTVWEQWAITASSDTSTPPNPDNLDDAALTLGRLLCGAGADMSTPEGWQKAVASYNPDPRFIEAVNFQAKSFTD